MIKAMIMTVGGSIEPILKSINHHSPDFVVYLVSEQSEKQIKDILNKSKIEHTYEIIKIKDAQNLLEAYTKSLDAAKLIKSKGFEKDAVIVDFTGGTKPMSSGVSLATISENFVFSYIGGIERNKGGLGTVITGKEEVFKRQNPWQIYAIKEKDIAIELFNKHQFISSTEMLKMAEEKLAPFPDKKNEIDKLILVAKAYNAWDKFEHLEARNLLQKLDRVDIKDNINFLDELLKQIHIFKKKLESNGMKVEEVPTEYLIIDLFSNARRRAEEGKFDDACARLYRTLEVIGQFILFNNYYIDPSDIKLDNLKDRIQEEYIKEYENKRDKKDGKIKFGLVENFEFLKRLKYPAIDIYIKNEEDIKLYLSFRNNSILAHGFKPIGQEKYERFEKIIIKLLKSIINNFDELIKKTKFPTL